MKAKIIFVGDTLAKCFGVNSDTKPLSKIGTDPKAVDGAGCQFVSCVRKFSAGGAVIASGFLRDKGNSNVSFWVGGFQHIVPANSVKVEAVA